jgi:hypothetical protein
MTKRLISLTLLAVSAAACGTSSDDGGSPVIKAPVVPGSTQAGLAFSANNVDDSLSTARVYYYDFASGEVKELLDAEARSPGVFYVDGQLFVFNRTESERNVSFFDPKAVAAALEDGKSYTPARTDLPDLAPNDPWDVVPLVAGQSVLLASPSAGKLQTFDYATGQLSDTTIKGAAATGLRPNGLLHAGTRVDILHTGTSASGQGDGTQAIFLATADGSGALTFVDTDTSSPGAIDGVKITPTNPSGFIGASSSSALVVGLCTPSITHCDAGADRFQPTGTSVQPVATLDDLPYAFHNQIVAGPTADTVFAHVVTADDEYKVIKIDLETKAVEDVHTFPDERLYGIAYDSGSKTLFVGGHDGIKGTLTLYRDGAEAGTVQLDGVPFSTALVSH